MSVRSLLNSLRTQWPELVDAARALPAVLANLTHRAQSGQLSVKIEAPGAAELAERKLASSRRRDAITIGAVILLGGLIWLTAAHLARWPGWE